MVKTIVATDKLTFKTKISKMGEKKLIIIPAALHDMIKENNLESETVRITIEKIK